MQRGTAGGRNQAAIVGVAVLALAGGAFVAALTGAADPSSPGATTSVRTAVAASQPASAASAPSTGLTPSASATGDHTPEPGLLSGTMAAVTTDGDRLRVRSAPGTGPDSERLPAPLEAGDRLLVLDGPVPADGFDWYRVYDGPSARSGWVAAGNADGVAWIRPVAPVCPEPSEPGSFANALPSDQFVCFAGTRVELEVRSAVLVEPPGFPCAVNPDGVCADVEPAWLRRIVSLFLGEYDPGDGEMGVVLEMSAVLGPDLSPTSLADADLSIVTLSYDDPRSQQCRILTADGEDAIDPAAASIQCRLLPVIVAVRRTTD